MFNQHYFKIKCNEYNKNINHGNIVAKNNKVMHYICYKKGKKMKQLIKDKN